jgi:hypothetical protein
MALPPLPERRPVTISECSFRLTRRAILPT